MKPHRYFFLLLVLWTVSCEGPEISDLPVPDKSFENKSWYILDKGLPLPVDRSSLASLLERENPDKLWTVQTRPVGFAQVGEHLFTGINRCGVMRIFSGQDNTLLFEPIFDRELFNGRTLGLLFLLNGRLCAHLYANPILGGDDPCTPLENLVCLEENSENYERITLGRNLSFWELTHLIPVSTGWMLQWRGAGGNSGTTDYELRGILEKPGEEISADEFRSGYGFIPLDAGPSLYTWIFQKAANFYKTSSLVVHIVERNTTPVQDKPILRYYRGGDIGTLTDEGTVFITLQAVLDGEKRFVLFPDISSVLFSARDEEPTVIDLPEVGNSVIYTYIWPLDDGCVISWEQKGFSKTGRSGFLFIPIPSMVKQE